MFQEEINAPTELILGTIWEGHYLHNTFWNNVMAGFQIHSHNMNEQNL